MTYTISETLYECLCAFSMILAVASIWLISTLALKSYFDRQHLLNECKELFEDLKNGKDN